MLLDVRAGGTWGRGREIRTSERVVATPNFSHRSHDSDTTIARRASLASVYEEVDIRAGHYSNHLVSFRLPLSSSFHQAEFYLFTYF